MAKRRPAPILATCQAADHETVVFHRCIVYCIVVAGRGAGGVAHRGGGDGKPRTILRADVAEMNTTPRSLMPEGLEAGLIVDEMAYLLAFIANPN